MSMRRFVFVLITIAAGAYFPAAPGQAQYPSAGGEPASRLDQQESLL